MGVMLGDNTAGGDLENSTREINSQLQDKGFLVTSTEDIINWVANPPGSWTGKYEQTSSKKKREGIELTNYFTYSEKTSLDLSYTYIAGENGKKVIRVPRNLLKASLNSKISPKLFLNGSIKYNTDICDTINGVICEVDLDDYTLINMLAEYELYESLSLKFRIENILNQSYQTVYNFGTSQRAFYLGIDNVF